MNSAFLEVMDFFRRIGLAALDAAKTQSHVTQVILVLFGFFAWSAFFYWVGYGDGREDKKASEKRSENDAQEPMDMAA